MDRPNVEPTYDQTWAHSGRTIDPTWAHVTPDPGIYDSQAFASFPIWVILRLAGGWHGFRATALPRVFPVLRPSIRPLRCRPFLPGLPPSAAPSALPSALPPSFPPPPPRFPLLVPSARLSPASLSHQPCSPVGYAVEPVPSACCPSVLLLVDRSDSSPDLRTAPCAVPGGQPPSFEGCCWGARIPSPRPGRLCSTIAIPPPCLGATVNLPPLATPLRNLLFECWRYLGLSSTYLGPMLPPRSPMLPVCWPMSTLCCRALALSCPYVGLMVAYVAAMLASL